MELVGCEDDETGKSNSDVGSTRLQSCEVHNKLKPLFFVDGYKGEGGYLKVLGKKLEGYFTNRGSVNGMAVLVGEYYKNYKEIF